jgi:hypothetical protein
VLSLLPPSFSSLYTYLIKIIRPTKSEKPVYKDIWLDMPLFIIH